MRVWDTEVSKGLTALVDNENLQQSHGHAMFTFDRKPRPSAARSRPAPAKHPAHTPVVNPPWTRLTPSGHAGGAASPATAQARSRRFAPSSVTRWPCAGVIPPVQRAAMGSAPGSPHEHEAEDVADEVMRGAEPGPTGVAPDAIQRQGAAREHGYEDLIAASRGIGPQGAVLDAGTRAAMERRFNADFGSVRVHTGPDAASAASELRARAYTLGEHIVLSVGQRVSQEEPHGNVLAHELAHVVQQRAGGSAAGAERRARTAAVEVSRGSNVSAAALGGAPVGLYREDVDNPLVRPHKEPSFKLKLDDFSLWAATLDEFVADSAALTQAHQKRLDDAVKLIQALLANGAGRVEVTGHTDAVGAEAHNDALGQRRADSVAEGLKARGIEGFHIWTSSKGEMDPVVETHAANGKNRRVEVRFKPLPPVAPLPLPRSEGRTKPRPDFTLPPVWTRPRPGTPLDWFKGTPPLNITVPDPDWLKNALEEDAALRTLPGSAREKAIDALKTADETLADEILDTLPVEGNTKQAVKAAVKALLQKLKGKSSTPPTPPPPQHEQPPSNAPKMDEPPTIKSPAFKWR